jgi:uncharacterized membrane protein
MKVQIKRFSLHQNAKVFAVMAALSSFVLLTVIYLIFSLIPMPMPHRTPSAQALFVIPLIYLVLTYVMAVIGCAIYNLVNPLIGGVEYEVENKDA